MILNKKLIGLSCIALLATSGCTAYAEEVAAVPQAAEDWIPAQSSIVYPAQNTDVDGWRAYEGRFTTPSIDQNLTDPILQGAIDLHAHYGPDVYDRQWDAFEVAKIAKTRGLRGVVIKNHWSESAAIAGLVRTHADADGLEVFGALSLNVPVGGINPQAIRYFAEVEGRFAQVVWMPTHDSEHEVKYLKDQRPYVVVSRGGELIPEIYEVLDLIKQYDLTLATGHVTAEEALMIMTAANERGIDKIIVTHPHMGPAYTDPSIEQMRKAVELGGYIEVVAANLLGPKGNEFIDILREIGAEHCFISSDSGLIGTNNLTDALVLSIRKLRENGFSEADLDLMFRKNPAFLVGLPPLD